MKFVSTGSECKIGEKEEMIESIHLLKIQTVMENSNVQTLLLVEINIQVAALSRVKLNRYILLSKQTTFFILALIIVSNNA